MTIRLTGPMGAATARPIATPFATSPKSIMQALPFSSDDHDIVAGRISLEFLNQRRAPRKGARLIDTALVCQFACINAGRLCHEQRADNARARSGVALVVPAQPFRQLLQHRRVPNEI